MHYLSGIKENSNICKLGEAVKTRVRVSLSHSASQCATALYGEAGKYHLFGLVRVCIDSGDKKRQPFELHKVVSTCGPDGIRNSDA